MPHTLRAALPPPLLQPRAGVWQRVVPSASSHPITCSSGEKKKPRALSGELTFIYSLLEAERSFPQ